MSGSQQKCPDCGKFLPFDVERKEWACEACSLTVAVKSTLLCESCDVPITDDDFVLWEDGPVTHTACTDHPA